MFGISNLEIFKVHGRYANYLQIRCYFLQGSRAPWILVLTEGPGTHPLLTPVLALHSCVTGRVSHSHGTELDSTGTMTLHSDHSPTIGIVNLMESAARALEPQLTLWVPMLVEDQGSNGATVLHWDFQSLLMLLSAHLEHCPVATEEVQGVESCSWIYPTWVCEDSTPKQNKASCQTQSWRKTHQWALPRPEGPSSSFEASWALTNASCFSPLSLR